MSPVIRDTDHSWALQANHDPVFYANELTSHHELMLGDTADDSVVVRSVAGTSAFYNIVEIHQEEPGLMDHKWRTIARFQHDDSPRTTTAEDILKPYRREVLDTDPL